jgi:SAM-dependent MidA family methyltransferase
MSSSNPSLSLPEPPEDLLALSQSLCNRMVNAISTTGPMPFDHYMRMALYEPGLGYYVNGLHKFGQAGDFVTAPEQGRIFATALARQVEEAAGQLGHDWTLFELGAGSGTLARDLLQALDQPPGRYLILEPSAPLRDMQAETLAGLPENLRTRVEWLNSPPDELFDGIIIANEVIDALPVTRFEITESGLAELAVTVVGDRFDWTFITPSPRLQQAWQSIANALPRPLPVGYRSEICVDLHAWLDTVTRPLERGLVLMIDYGYPRAEYYLPERSDGTLVCHYRHRAHFDPFVWPGLTDLSAFVDFTAVAEAAVDCGLEVTGFTNQTGFLLALGAHEIVEQVEDDLTRLQLAGEFKRLTMPGEMGERFKVIGLTRGLDQQLSGFAMMDQLHRL